MPHLQFGDVEIGDGPPPCVRIVTTRQLVQYAAASGDFTPIHYDRDYAREAGHQSVILHGALKSSMLAQMLTEWIAPKGELLELEASYRAVDYPGVPITCSGKVIAKRIENAIGILELEIEIRNDQGLATTPGRATVSLPIRI